LPKKSNILVSGNPMKCEEFSLPRFISIPEVPVASSGDFQRDLLARLSGAAESLTETAKYRALLTAFDPGRKIHEPHDSQTPAIAADVLRQVIAMVENVAA
jgi:hypothetical protein